MEGSKGWIVSKIISIPGQKISSGLKIQEGTPIIPDNFSVSVVGDTKVAISPGGIQIMIIQPLNDKNLFG